MTVPDLRAIPDLRATRNYTLAENATDPIHAGSSGDPFSLRSALWPFQQRADRAQAELQTMRSNFKLEAQRAAAKAIQAGVNLLSQAPGVAQGLSPEGALVPVVATTLGRITTGVWTAMPWAKSTLPVVNTVLDCANIASWALIAYKKCQPEETGNTAMMDAASLKLDQMKDSDVAQNFPYLGKTIEKARSWAFTAYEQCGFVGKDNALMIAAASWVGGHILKKTPIIKSIVNIPVANNCIWGARLGSAAFLATHVVGALRAYNDRLTQKRLAEIQQPRIVPQAPTGPTPLTAEELRSNLLAFQEAALNFQIVDIDVNGHKRCLPASAVQAFAQIGVTRSQHTQPSDLSLLEDIRNLTEAYAATKASTKGSTQDRATLRNNLQKATEAYKLHTVGSPANKTALIAVQQAEIACLLYMAQQLTPENQAFVQQKIGSLQQYMVLSVIYSQAAEALTNSSTNSSSSTPVGDALDRIKSRYSTLPADTTKWIAGVLDPIIQAGSNEAALSMVGELSTKNLSDAAGLWESIKGDVPLYRQLANEAAAKKTADAALHQKASEHLALLTRISTDAQRNYINDTYPTVLVKIDEFGQVLVSQSMCNKGRRTKEIENELTREMTNLRNDNAVRIMMGPSNDQRFLAKMPLYGTTPQGIVNRLGKQELDQLHPSEEFIASVGPFDEKFIYRAPDDLYSVGNNSDHKLTAALLLKMGQRVQSDLITKFAAGTLFTTDTLENIESMIGFLDLCQNHRVTRLTSGEVPSFLEDQAYQNHWSGFSIIREHLKTQLAEHYALQQTRAGVQAKKNEDGTFAEPTGNVTARQEEVLGKAISKLETLVNRNPVQPVRQGTTMQRNAFRKDFEDLQSAVKTISRMRSSSSGGSYFSACEAGVLDTRRREKLADGTYRNSNREIPALEMLYEASGSMMLALENPNVAPVIAATLQIDAKTLITELKDSLEQIDIAYKEYVQLAGYNDEELCLASNKYKFALKTSKLAEMNARKDYYMNYFESPKIPSTVSIMFGRMKSAVSGGTKAAQTGVGQRARVVASGVVAGLKGVSSMFGAGLRRKLVDLTLPPPSYEETTRGLPKGQAGGALAQSSSPRGSVSGSTGGGAVLKEAPPSLKGQAGGASTSSSSPRRSVSGSTGEGAGLKAAAPSLNPSVSVDSSLGSPADQPQVAPVVAEPEEALQLQAALLEASRAGPSQAEPLLPLAMPNGQVHQPELGVGHPRPEPEPERGGNAPWRALVAHAFMCNAPTSSVSVGSPLESPANAQPQVAQVVARPDPLQPQRVLPEDSRAGSSQVSPLPSAILNGQAQQAALRRSEHGGNSNLDFLENVFRNAPTVAPPVMSNRQQQQRLVVQEPPIGGQRPGVPLDELDEFRIFLGGKQPEGHADEAHMMPAPIPQTGSINATSLDRDRR